MYLLCFFFKQKTAYEMRISDWSSDVCSSDLLDRLAAQAGGAAEDSIVAPMPGSIVTVSVTVGDTVTRGQTLLVMESMKMETTKIGRASCRERVCQYV